MGLLLMPWLCHRQGVHGRPVMGLPGALRLIHQTLAVEDHCRGLGHTWAPCEGNPHFRTVALYPGHPASSFPGGCLLLSLQSMSVMGVGCQHLFCVC